MKVSVIKIGNSKGVRLPKSILEKYQIGEELFGYEASQKHCIIHIIGERPGTMHRNFSVYITTASASTWKNRGKVDHDITRVISGISDTSYQPKEAALEAASLIKEQLN